MFEVGIFRALAAAIILSAVTIPCSSHAASDKIRVGFLTTLSGPAAQPGQTHLEGFQIGLESLGNRLGGIPVDMRVVDDKLNPEVAVEAVQKFIRVDHVDFVTGIIYANVTMAAYKPVVDSKTWFISGFAGPSQLAGEMCNPYLFMSGYQVDVPYEAAGKYMSEKLGVKRVFIMSTNTVGGKDALAGFKRGYKGKVVGEIFTRFGQPDYSAEISQIRAAKPDALFFQYSGTSAITFMRQVSAAKLGIPIYSSMAMDETTIHGMGDAAVGAYSITTYVDDLPNAENKAFVDAYVAKYKRRPSMFAAFGYDDAMVINYAVASVKGDMSKKDAIRAALRNAKFDLARGPMRFGSNQVAIGNTYLTQVVKDQSGLHIKYRGLITENHRDSYFKKCRM